MTTDSYTCAPRADWVDPRTMLVDPYPTFDRLRRQGPVVWVPAVNRYLVVGFHAGRTVDTDTRTYSADVVGTAATMVQALGANPMVRKDGRAHSAERAPVNAALRPRDIGGWSRIFERNARTHLDELVVLGPDRADLNDYAGAVAAHNLVDMLGMPDTTPGQMRAWSQAFIAGVGNVHHDPAVWARCDTARDEVDALLDQLLPHRQRHPDRSIISALGQSGMSRDAVRANVKLIMAGGLNEPQHMITNIVWALSRHPDQRDCAEADPTLWPSVFHETLRWLSPLNLITRRTTTATVLDGVELPVNATLSVVVAAANRDPAVYEEPDRFDITRPRQPHLGFGLGAHICPGHLVSRLGVGEVAVPMLYRELAGLRTDPRRVEQWHGWVFRGLTELPVTWG